VRRHQVATSSGKHCPHPRPKFYLKLRGSMSLLVTRPRNVVQADMFGPWPFKDHSKLNCPSRSVADVMCYQNTMVANNRPLKRRKRVTINLYDFLTFSVVEDAISNGPFRLSVR
ncbi:unnamed protein product, partial [Ilex paraguariensis]